MTAFAVLLIISAAGEPDAVRTAERLLRGDPDLLQIHRGYLAYLADHDSVRTLESQVNDLRRVPEFRDAVAPFEEWLLRAPQSRQRYMAYLDALHENPEMVRAVDTLDAIEAEEVFDGPFESPMVFMRAEPAAAFDFLRDPQDIRNVPQPLLPYISQLRRDDSLRQRLVDALEPLRDMTTATTALRAWWAAAARADAQRALSPLEEHMAGTPAHAAPWRARELELSRDPAAYPWVAYWHARVRRQPRLAAVYYEYLHEKLEAAASVQPRPIETDSPGDTGLVWPPATQPPALPEWTPETGNAPAVLEPERPTIPLPVPPKMRQPTAPKMPRRPIVPTVPQPQPRKAGP